MHLFRFQRPTGTIADLVKISGVSILLYRSLLIYHIAVPLTDFLMYDLYKASPLPVPQSLTNDSKTYAYIWPSSRLFALSQSKDTDINIQPELLGKCKKLKELYICQGTEPDQALSNRAACQIKLAAKKIINNISECDIRLVKLDVTYWARTSSANIWAFSTGKNRC